MNKERNYIPKCLLNFIIAIFYLNIQHILSSKNETFIKYWVGHVKQIGNINAQHLVWKTHRLGCSTEQF